MRHHGCQLTELVRREIGHSAESQFHFGRDAALIVELYVGDWPLLKLGGGRGLLPGQVMPLGRIMTLIKTDWARETFRGIEAIRLLGRSPRSDINVNSGDDTIRWMHGQVQTLLALRRTRKEAVKKISGMSIFVFNGSLKGISRFEFCTRVSM